MATAGGDYPATPKKKPVCGCTEHSTRGSARRDPRAAPADDARGRWQFWNGARQRLRDLPAGAQLLPAVDLAEAKPQDDPQIALHQRARARQHPEGRHLFRDPAHVGRRDHAADLRRIADVVDKYKIPTVKVTGGQRDRPARREEGRPAGGVAGPRHAVGPRLCEGPAHGQDLRRLRMVPLRHAGLDADGQGSGTRAVAHVRTAQGQAGGLGLPAQLRRGRHQGRRRDRRRLGLGDLRRRQRRHQDRSRAVPVQGEDARAKCSSTPVRSCSCTARRAGISSARCITSRASGSTTSSSGSSRTPTAARRLWERLQFALDGEPDPWHEPAKAGVDLRQYIPIVPAAAAAAGHADANALPA